ncbi:IS1182 family transposase [Actinomycetospora lutea]|uniref:IS1182 family transposase n=1 Tax=Actinomycetospora lutea TaxID=663604 RepID=UPI0023658C7A|nr:IS1182 family transposase [Actinomycetospora lutea]MDD7938310.1 IS1182 family transposase [Actinomycetospora lutea]
MQGRSDDQRELLDVESVAGHLLKPGSVFAFLAAHRARLFPPELFADLFPTNRGRPSVPPEVVATVLVLQALHGLSDREAVEALTFDLRWKAACGLAITDTAFDPSTLTYWRRRLAGSDRPNRIFETVAQVVAESGAVAGKTRRALDSTILDDAVARQDTVTQLIAAIRRVAREVPDGADIIATVATSGHDYARPGKPEIAWDDPQARDELVSALVNDALAVLAGLEARYPGGVGLEEKATQAVALLALVAGQDVEPAEGSDGTDGRWRIARRTAPDRTISTVDPDTRHAHKSRERRQDGFKAHVVVEPDTGLITATGLTKATGPDNSDATVGIGLLADDPSLDRAAGEPVEVLADSAYATGDALAALEAAGHRAMVKPWPLRPTVAGGFTLDDFTHDATSNTVTCPNGVTRPVAASGAVTFGTHCRGCPLRQRCTTAIAGRSLTLGPHHALQRAHRLRARSADHLESYRRHRPMVERSIAWLTRGNRRVPHRGVTKNNAWLHTRVAAINLRRLLNLGLHLDRGRWALAGV